MHPLGVAYHIAAPYWLNQIRFWPLGHVPIPYASRLSHYDYVQLREPFMPAS